MGKDGIEKVESLFRYLRELVALRSQAVHDFKNHIWSLDPSVLPSDLPGVTVSYRDAFNDGSISGDPLISVRKPEFEACPELPPALMGWLEQGWDFYKNEPILIDRRDVYEDETWKLVSKRFEEDDDRVEALRSWLDLRARWVEKQCLVAKSRDLFVELYNIHADLRRDSETLELLMGTGFLHDRDNQGINHPVLLKGARMSFDPVDNVISIDDAEASPALYSLLLRDMPSLNLDCISSMEAEIEREQYHPFDRLQTPQFLKRLAHRLTPKSEFSEDPKATFSSHDSRLLIVMHPVFFVRRRIDGSAKAIDRILDSMGEGGRVPQYLIDIVEGGTMKIVESEAEQTIERKLAEVGGEDVDILLAKEANREQLAIARRIEQYNAVLVQGPPGTGKTHTIANLVGHFLSQGRSILVTSHTKKALSVLKEKLPEEMQDLCVSVLDDSNADMEKSIDAISMYSAAHTSAELIRRAEADAAAREAVIAELSDVRARIYASLNRESACIVFEGESITPIEAAMFVRENKERLEGVIPGRIAQGASFPLSDQELMRLYESNVALTEEEERMLEAGLPSPESILNPQALETLSETQLRARRRISSACAEGNWKVSCAVASGGHVLIETDFGLVNAFANRDGETKRLLALVNSYRGTERWRVRAAADGRKGGGYRARWDVLFAQIERTYGISQKIVAESLGKNVSIADGFSVLEARADIEKLREVLQRKGRISKMDRVRNKGFDAIDAAVRINGRTLQSPEDCLYVLKCAALEESRETCRAYWKELMSDYGAPCFDELDPSEPERVAYNWIAHIGDYLNWYGTRREQLVRCMEDAGVTPVSTVLRESSLDSEEANVLRTLEAMERTIPRICEIALASAEYLKSEGTIRAYAAALQDSRCSNMPVCRALHGALAGLDLETYRNAYRECEEIRSKHDAKVERDRLLERLSGYAPDWADAVRGRRGAHGRERPSPSIREAWKYSQYELLLDELCGIPLNELQERAFQLSELYRKRTQALAQHRAWMHLLKRTEADITLKQALNGWKLAMKKVGKGTGAHAAEMKARAREQMALAQEAVPAWIMPMAKALDTLDPRHNRFDVIIVDEASQSDVTALALTYMGDKVIIVGDDRQVSPLAVGMDGTKVKNLNEMYIKGRIPNDYLYLPETSLYDIASTTFQPLMLREHFRCVPQIIGYCNMLSYDFKIKPLREPGSSNLLPAVVSHRVSGGVREGRSKTNRAEAEEIVALMMACMRQPEYSGKTFGVISLLGGGQQVKLIQQVMFNKMNLKDIEDRRIIVGESASFQGDERDVIFLSLVDASDGEGPLRIKGAGREDSVKKRYNVAISRAKDQLWVVHSLDAANDLKEDDLRKGLIEYAQDPDAFAQKMKRVDAAAESPFEAAVGRSLVAKGYRIIQQWEVGSYRIDMVAVGENGRVAIECDGERWHSGEEKIRSDMERQAILERIGWRFIRIRGSEYYRDPEVTIERVCRELGRLGIMPYSVEDAGEAPLPGSSDLLRRVMVELNATRDIVSDERPRIENRGATIAAALNGGGVDGRRIAGEGPRSGSLGSQEKPKPPTAFAERPLQATEEEPLFPADRASASPDPGLGERPRGDGACEAKGSKDRRLASETASRETDARAGQVPLSVGATADPIVASLAEKGLEFVDKRPSGGSLWVVGDRSIEHLLVCIAIEFDVLFEYSRSGGKATRHRPSWYMHERSVRKQAPVQAQGDGMSGENGPSADEASRDDSRSQPDRWRIAKKRYAAAKLLPRDIGGFASYTDKGNLSEIKERMATVIQIEAPIERQRLFKAVRASLGVGRSGSEIQAHNEYALRLIRHKTTTFNGTVFVWREDQNPNGYNEFRPNAKKNPRSVNEIPYEEILSAMRSVLSKQRKMPREGVIDGLAECFGFKRKGSRIFDVFGKAIDKAVGDGMVVQAENGLYTLPQI